jgi:hypothetical protein
VDRDVALTLLAPAYATAIRLDDSGTDLDEIARALDTDPEAVAPLLAIGRAKLAALVAASDLG